MRFFLVENIQDEPFVTLLSAEGSRPKRPFKSRAHALHHQLDVRSKKRVACQASQPLESVSQVEYEARQRCVLVLGAGRSETGLRTPETCFPAFQNVVGELLVRRIKFHVPDSGVGIYRNFGRQA
jgi:hypothetical protein